MTSISQSLRNSWWFETPSSNMEELALGILPLVLAAVAVSRYVWIFSKKTFGAPPSPPGPLGLPVVGNLPFLDAELHTYFAGLAQAYGPVIKLRLGNKIVVVISSPAAAREVLKEHDAIFANRDVPAAAAAASYGGRDIAWSQYGPEWRMLRKICVREMLGSAALNGVYELRRREIRKTVGYIYSRVGSPMMVGEQMFLTVLNVIMNMIWGDTVKGDGSKSLGAEFRQVVTEMTELMGKPNISDFFPGLGRFDLQGIKKRMKGLALRFDVIFNSLIDQRLRIEGQGGREAGNKDEEIKDFLQVLLRVKEEGDTKVPFTMDHLKALLMDMVVGSTDTSSSTVEFAMAELINKPELMRNAQEELDAVVGKDSTVDECHIHKLPYLQAVMKEILRLHPVLPLLVPHCPSQSCTVGGYHIPKGARVFVNAWAIHRDSCIWENPSEFNPERFFGGKWDDDGGGFSYIPFGSGRRICAGIAMAERMVMFSLASLLHSFDWKIPEGETLDLSEKFGIVLKKKTPLVVIPTPRLSDPALYA
ncbi:flavonoid 3'-monooxygenase CYP75B137-like [Malania oleifera]|uniref:flavonoid 3'-monooxygenase CYP75B137-like n=1 Tax=Malania oleifera TaxID=397392 RepID=UPI0025AE834E|nr:flavonoid 3'-monooxygenase CYP75B137-like [Malania oleifera]